ncbi:MAG: CotH kinase family protein, partial [Ruminococcus sp.]|nr:CotH kinase family protein [Ruminococcus sp.]
MFKKLLTGALALTLTMGSAALPETSFGDALNIVHAESESTAYTISDVENLLMTVPKYFEYYSEESTKDLKSVLAELDKVNLEDCSQEEIDYYYENISAGLNELEFKTAEVPQVYISTANDNGNTIQKTDDYVDTAIAIVDTDGKALTEYAGKIKVRGNSTAKAPKKAFNIKFSSKQNVLGMGKAKKWSLLANCYDPTLLRNYVALDFAQHMGLAYTSEKKIVELWVDGIFKGCYLLTESVEAGKTRVDIDTEGNKDFMIEYEAVRVEEDKTYIVSNGFRFALSEPEEPTEEQLNYITEILDEITGAIKTKDINEYGKYIDLESFAKYYMLNEFYKTVDFSNSSVYYYYKDGKLYAGPAWDYDLSSGNAYADYSAGYNQLSQSSAINANKQFYEDLYKSQDFLKIVWDYYVEYHDYIKQIYIPGGLIDTLVKDNAEVIKRNFTDAGWDVSYKYNICMRNPDATYEENLDFYKNWLFERDKWLLKFWRIQRNVDCYYNSEHVCEYCGANHQHTFGSWEITKEPTCTTEGIKTRNCTSCLEVETQTIPKKEHNFIATIVKPTYEVQGYTLHKCSVCGEEYKDNNTAKLVVPTVTGLKVAATSAQAVK